MIRLEFLTTGFETKILSGSLEQKIERPLGALFLDIEEKVESEYIYVTDEVKLGFVRKYGVLPRAIFVSTKTTDIEECPTGIPVVCVDLPKKDLLNFVSKNLSEWNEIEMTIRVARVKGIKSLLGVLSNQIKSSIYLFNSEYSLIEKFEKTSTLNQTLSPGSNRLQPKYLISNGSELQNDGVAYAENTNGSMIKITSDNETIGFLLISDFKHIKQDCFIVDYVCECIAEILAEDETETLIDGVDRFREFIENIRSLSFFDSERMYNDLALLEYPIKRMSWISFLIIRTESGRALPSRAIAEFKNIFSKCNVTFYDGVLIVLLVNESVTQNSINYDVKLLEEKLCEYNAIALRSNGATLPVGIRSEYILTREIIELVPKLRFSGDARCANIERYQTYCMIHFYASHIAEDLGHSKLVYFASPQVLSLTLYDSRNKTDLRDVLFNYITNDCNVNKTAEMMHMHRNTVFYKLNKIKDLVGIDLDTPSQKAGILFSCHLLRYIEEIQNISVAVVEAALPK